MAGKAVPLRAARPVLDSTLHRGSSYLREHQQYKPPPPPDTSLLHQGIDSIVDSTNISPPISPSKLIIGTSYATGSSSRTGSGVSSPNHSSSPRIVDSGLNHTLSHTNCQAPLGVLQDARMVATLVYKSNAPRTTIDDYPPDRAPPSAHPAAAANSRPIKLHAPVPSLSTFPLEPPPPDPEPLDHLYGSYISPICLTSFLHLIASLPVRHGADTLSSSHRCLDNPDHPLVLEVTFSPTPDPTYLTLGDLRKHELIYRFEKEWNVDVTLQYDTILRRYPRLVVFDMDSTLIEQEVIDLIAASMGVEAEVSAITRRAMNGELDFSASLRERVKLLKGVDADIFTRLRDVITPTKGARELIRALKRLGCRTAVLSGGFIPLTQWLATELGIDYAYANTLTTDEATGTLSGEVMGDIVNAERKRDLLIEIAGKEKVELGQVLAVGDGANDLLMLEKAGLGVAFKAKPLVQMQAHARLNSDSLLDLLYFFGLTNDEVSVLIA